MLNSQTTDKLLQLRLSTMSETYLRLESRQNELSFDELFGLIVDSEWTSRRNKRLSRLLKDADLRLNASIEDINFVQPRGLDRNQINKLSECGWIGNNQNIIVTGCTGTGKTYLACAFGNMACRRDYTVRYYRIPRLLTDIAITKTEGTYNRQLRQLKNISLLILDDWGISRFEGEAGRELLEVIEDRSGIGSTIIVSQLPITGWYELFDNPTVADACLDRLVHNAIKIDLAGDKSMRGIYSDRKETLVIS